MGGRLDKVADVLFTRVLIAKCMTAKQKHTGHRVYLKGGHGETPIGQKAHWGGKKEERD